MSGHSKWSTIRHKKAALDAKRGKVWSKIARDITIAARLGGGDVATNPRLRLSIDKARSANMPKDNIERAIAKGTGEGQGDDYEECVYEGYGPAGVAVMATALTDNRARTAPEIKKIFERSGGNMGAPHSVSWMFASKGIIVVARENADEEHVMEVAIEAGAEDVANSEPFFEITTEPGDFLTVKDAIVAAGIDIASAEVTHIASNNVSVDLGQAKKVMRLLDALDDHDDVQNVSSNMDLPDDVASQLDN